MRRIHLAALAIALGLLPLVASADGAPALGPGWARLGPVTPRPPDLFAIDPDWPTSKVLLAAKQPLTAQPDPFYSYLLRSRDGGEHWEILPGPGIGVSDVQMAPGAVFVIDGDRFYGGQRAVYRSADLGSTWQTVLELDPSSPTTLALSPNFQIDHTAFVVNGGVAYRGRDGGKTFAALEAALKQVVVTKDGRVFAVAEDAATIEGEWQGILVSTDGGDSWTPLGSDGLTGPGGEPMLDPLQLVVSPTVERDNTMFVVTRREPEQTGVFRTQDGGSSWQLVAGGQRVRIGRTSFSLALSATFADDGFAVLAENYAGGSPASHSCTLQTSTDAGSTWVAGPRPGNYESCAEISVDRVNGRLVASAWKNYTFLLSLDGDTQWSARLNVVADNASNDRPLLYSRARSTGVNGTLFFATRQGLAGLGGGVQSTASMIMCEPPVAGFGRVWQTEARVRSGLGCPLEAERPLRIREAIVRGHRTVWTEDDSPRSYELLDNDTLLVGSRREASASDSVIDGAAQRFEGGVMLWLPEPSGKRTILVVFGNTEWREFPD